MACGGSNFSVKVSQETQPGHSLGQTDRGSQANNKRAEEEEDVIVLNCSSLLTQASNTL